MQSLFPVFQAPIGLTKPALLKRRSLLSCIFTKKKKKAKVEEEVDFRFLFSSVF